MNESVWASVMVMLGGNSVMGTNGVDFFGFFEELCGVDVVLGEPATVVVLVRFVVAVVAVGAGSGFESEGSEGVGDGIGGEEAG
jgi:hypothetical protein